MYAHSGEVTTEGALDGQHGTNRGLIQTGNQAGGSGTQVDRPRTLELGAHECAPRTAAIKASRALEATARLRL